MIKRLKVFKIPKPKLYFGIGLFIILIICGLVVLIVQKNQHHQKQIKTEIIYSYFQALQSGDLTQLRKITCGKIHVYYSRISKREFVKIHNLAKNFGQIPTLEKIQNIRMLNFRNTLATVQIRKKQKSDRFSSQNLQILLKLKSTKWLVCN